MAGAPDLLLLDGGIGHLLKAKGVESLVPGLNYDQVSALVGFRIKVAWRRRCRRRRCRQAGSREHGLQLSDDAGSSAGSSTTSPLTFPPLIHDCLQLFLAGALANQLAPEAVMEVHQAYLDAGGCCVHGGFSGVRISGQAGEPSAGAHESCSWRVKAGTSHIIMLAWAEVSALPPPHWLSASCWDGPRQALMPLPVSCAGAGIITTNTFACTQWSLARIGRQDRQVGLPQLSS